MICTQSQKLLSVAATFSLTFFELSAAYLRVLNCPERLLVSQRPLALELLQNFYELTVAHYVAAVKLCFPPVLKTLLIEHFLMRKQLGSLQKQKSQTAMKIQIITIAIFCMCASYAVTAQTSDAEADAIINLLGVKKKEAISKLVYVTGSDSAVFWKIYNEYQQLNKNTAKSRILLYEKTAESYQTMTPVRADSLAQQYFKNRVEQEKMLQDYYAKIKAATNSVIAFEFYQAEVYILTQIRASIMQQIPTYGELHAMAKKN